jgi:hypothetical protein
VGQVVRCRILGVDSKAQRLKLSLASKKATGEVHGDEEEVAAVGDPLGGLQAGDVVAGTVSKVCHPTSSGLLGNHPRGWGAARGKWWWGPGFVSSTALKYGFPNIVLYLSTKPEVPWWGLDLPCHC